MARWPVANNLQKVIQTIASSGRKLNKFKCSFNCHEIDFLGHSGSWNPDTVVSYNGPQLFSDEFNAFAQEYVSKRPELAHDTSRLTAELNGRWL